MIERVRTRVVETIYLQNKSKIACDKRYFPTLAKQKDLLAYRQKDNFLLLLFSEIKKAILILITFSHTVIHILQWYF